MTEYTPEASEIARYPVLADLCRMGCTITRSQPRPTFLRDGSSRFAPEFFIELPLVDYCFAATDPGCIETLEQLEQWCRVNGNAIYAEFKREKDIEECKQRYGVRFLPRQVVKRWLEQ